VAEARCGAAAGWVLASAPPSDPERVQAVLNAAVERRTALALQDLARAGAHLGWDALERLTHRLSTDVMTLHAVAEAALAGLFKPEDLEELPGELDRTANEARRRLNDARAVMSVLDRASARAPESIVETLRGELDAASRDVAVTGPDHERPLTLIAGAGWAACARRLASDERLGAFTVAPDPAGWRVSTDATGAPLAWNETELGPLAHAGHLVAAAGGTAAATHGADGALGIALVLPAAPPD
jgi:hypothetical protein